MNFDKLNLENTERVIFELKELYESYGYSQYKMSKFEEYDLYVRNKNFLLSDNIITFTDMSGKLMALKPDVTLSIVKNIKESEKSLSKVYYNENVYRVPRGAVSYKEIMQTGLECIGQLDAYSLCEVISLAAKSLEKISEDFVLDVSDLGIVSCLVGELTDDREVKDKLLKCVGEKNVAGIDAVCSLYSIESVRAEKLKSLMTMSGRSEDMLMLLDESECSNAARELAEMIELLRKEFGDKIRIDFSVIDDMNYYNGIVFKGFVKGIPSSVLSGGRYDSLMYRMGKKSGAVGFAVYLDLLEDLFFDAQEYDVDVFLLYSEADRIEDISNEAKMLIKSGKRVLCGKTVPEKLRYRELRRI